MNIDYSQARFWWDVAQALATLALTAVVYLRKPGLDAKADVNTIREKLDSHIAETKTELAIIEERIKHLPTREQLAQVVGRLENIGVQNTALHESLGTLRAATGRIESYLLNERRNPLP